MVSTGWLLVLLVVEFCTSAPGIDEARGDRAVERRADLLVGFHRGQFCATRRVGHA